jgi:DNA modification methylase
MTWQRKETLAEGVEVYLGDCRTILPMLPRADACITDPPYGIKQDRGMGGGGYDGFGKGMKRQPNDYDGQWDRERPSRETFTAILKAASKHIIWGGNYFSDYLPVSQKWLWWDKMQTMPTYSDGELAWTNLDGASTKKFVYNGSGLLAREQDREHPTQKPVELMKWCLGFLPDARTILDPMMGSGTTGVAATKLGRKFIGIERVPAYYEISLRRISEALSQPDLFIVKPRPVKQESFL